MSIFLDRAPSKIEKLVKRLKTLTDSSIYKGHVFIVGGCVRDVLIGNKNIKDVDIVIDLMDGGVTFSNWLAYRTGCLISGKNPCIFPKYRTSKMNLLNDMDLSDIVIEVVQTYNKRPTNDEGKTYHAVSQTFGTLDEDVLLRDFTVNSLYYDITNDKLIDKCGAMEDLMEGRLRCVTDPNKVFGDDPVRMLRGLKLAKKHKWGIDSKTWLGMVINASKIKTVPVENIRNEFDEMIVMDDPSEVIEKLHKCGILGHLIPDLVKAKHVYQDLRPRRSVYQHTMECLDKSATSLHVRLAALFHDIGKVETFDKSFLYHQLIGATAAEKWMKNMKYSTKTIDTVKLAIEAHEDFSSWRGESIPRSQVIRKFMDSLEFDDHVINVALELIHANNITQMFGKRAKQVQGIKLKMEEIKKKELNNSEKKLHLPIGGVDIKERYNIKTGPAIGFLLNAVKNACMEKPGLTKEEAFAITDACIKKLV